MRTPNEVALCRALDALCTAVESQDPRSDSPRVRIAVADARKTLAVEANYAPNARFQRLKLTDFEAAVFLFANQRWPNRDLPGRVRKLGEEYGELAEAVARFLSRSITGSEQLEEARMTVFAEAADCAMVLDDLCALADGSLQAAKARKFEQNRQRADLKDTKAKGVEK